MNYLTRKTTRISYAAEFLSRKTLLIYYEYIIVILRINTPSADLITNPHVHFNRTSEATCYEQLLFITKYFV